MADLSDNTNWFEVDASNNKASPNGWPEGMMPSGVNDSARNDKGALKRFWDRINPVTQITPSGAAWVFNTSNTAYPTAYVAGEIYSFIAGGDAAGNDTFAVNALGAKPIYVATTSGTPRRLVAHDWLFNQRPRLAYDSGLNGGAGGFWLLNPYTPIASDGAGGAHITGSLTVGGTTNLTGQAIVHSGGLWSYSGAAGTEALYAQQNLGSAPPNNSGTNQSAGFIGRLADNTGMVLDLGGEGGSGFWLDVTNSNDLSQHYPLLLNPLGGAVHVGADGLSIDGGSLQVGGVGNFSSALNTQGDIATSGNLHVNSGTIWLPSGGYISQDANNCSFRLPTGNGYWTFLNNSNTSVAHIDSAGGIVTGASGNLTVGGGSCFFGTSNAQIYGDANSLGFRLPSGNGSFWFVDAGSNGVAHIDNAGDLYIRDLNCSNVATVQNSMTVNGPLVGYGVGSVGDMGCSGVYRTGGSSHIGARLECYGGDWNYMSLAIQGGSFNITPNNGANGFFVPMTAWSDARLKTHIHDTQVDALAALLQTPVREFRWNKQGRELMPYLEPDEAIGLVAQEVAEAMPGVVRANELAGGLSFIDAQRLDPYLIRAIQQLADRLTALEGKERA